MALLSRIFQSRKSNKQSTTKWYTLEERKKTEPEFCGSQVRLLLYRDQDLKGRNLLFDSKTVQRVEPPATKRCPKKEYGAKRECTEKASNLGSQVPKYNISRAGSDIKMLEEMAFGAVGMAFKGSTLKVHTIRLPPQLMVTKVFIPSLVRARDSGSVEAESFDCSLNYSSTELTMPQKITSSQSMTNPSIAHSVPMDVPSPQGRSPYTDNEPEDSGFSTSNTSSLSSLTTSIPRSSSSSSLNSSSYNSMTRRWRRSQHTSLEHVKRHSDEGVYEQPLPTTKRPWKVGLAVVISLSEEDDENSRLFQNFFFSHITLIEGHMEKLKLGIERALSNRKSFAHLMMEALENFRQLLVDLYLTPRLPAPVWLDMMCYTTHRVSLCQRFLSEFMVAFTKYDTKQTKFFLSTLLTGVLTNHLAWVPTVTPAGATPSQSYMDKHSAKWLDAVAKSHPYNPLWAQLGDLYGALGFPLRLTRTVVVGKKSDVINRFLYILSYFIRCSEVLESSQQPYDFEYVDSDTEEDECLDVLYDGVSTTRTSQTIGKCTCGVHSPTMSPSTCTQCSANCMRLDCNSSSVGNVPLSRPEASFTRLKGGPMLDTKVTTEDPGGGVIKERIPIPQRTSSPITVSPLIDTIALFHDTSIDRTVQSEQTILSSKAESIDDRCDKTNNLQAVDSQTICVMAPNLVNEDVAIERVRHIGRQAPECGLVMLDSRDALDPLTTELVNCPSKLPLSAFGSNKNNSVSSVIDCSKPNSSNCDNVNSHKQRANVTNEAEKLEYSNDSGSYDMLLIPTNTICHKGPVKSDGCYIPEPNMLEQTTTDNSTSNEREPDTMVYNNRPKFERSNSMFDEYFTEDAESSRVDSEVQGSNNWGSDYTSDMFDEYFSSSGFGADDKFTKNPEHHKPSAAQCLGRGELCQRVPLVDRRKAPHLDSLILKTSTVEDDDITPRPRHLSNQSTTTLTSARVRSATPTKLKRGRHVSSLSTTSSIEENFFTSLKEIAMPTCDCAEKTGNEPQSFQRNFGRSLMAGASSHYLSDFVLHGTTDNNFQAALHNDLSIAVKNSVLDEQMSESVCIVADIDNWTVKLQKCYYDTADRVRTQEVVASPLICNIIESVSNLSKLKMSAEFCLMHLEDRLQEIYFKSRTLAEFLRVHNRIDVRQLATLLKLDVNDIPLLLSVAGTHTPLMCMGLL